MNLLSAIFLGAIQGITEFLPVSSSGHLVLFQQIFHLKEAPLLFDTILHLGTLTAVCVVLWKDIWAILKRPFQRLTGLVIVATIPTVILALLFKKLIERAFETGTFLGFGFLLTALVLLIAEKLAQAKATGPAKNVKDMRWTDAILVGTLQGVAILPAVSRSGMTISGSLSRGLDRDFAARFSFLMSIPAILGAAVLQAKDFFGPSTLSSAGNAVPGGGLSAIGVGALVAGTLTAAVVGIVAVRFMLRVIRNNTLRGFALYTAILGVVVLVNQFALRLF